VRYASGAKDKATLVLAALGGAGKLVAASGSTGGADVVLVLGRDYHGLSTPTTTPSTTHPPASTAHPAAAAHSGTTASTLPVAGC
jgi:hypothetical protein